MKKLAILSGALASLLVSGPVLAHPGEHGFSGFAAGMGHMLGHADHALVLVAALAVAGLATRQGIRKRVAAMLKRRSL